MLARPLALAQLWLATWCCVADIHRRRSGHDAFQTYVARLLSRGPSTKRNSHEAIALATLALMFAAMTLAQTTAGTVTVVAPDGQSRQLTAAELNGLARESVTATVHDKTAIFAGSDLRYVLRAAGVEPPDHIRGAAMRRAIVVQGADGYSVTFAFAELDPSLGDRRVHLVDRMNDQPLPPSDGPWRLVVPRDARGARWVRQVTRVTVVDLPN